MYSEGGWFSRSGPEGDVALASRVRLARNIIDHPFPNLLTDDEELKIRDELISTFNGLPGSEKFTILYLKDIPPLERRLLLERNIINQAFSLGGEKAVIVDSNRDFYALINEGDHVRIAFITEGLSLQEAYEKVDCIDSLLEVKLPYACSLEWGYLNSSLADLGTGLRASVMVHLPALGMTTLIEKALKVITQLGLSVKGFFGTRTVSLGDMYQISNQISLGMSEQEILDKLNNVAVPLINYERQARGDLLEKRRVEVEDKIFRAWGILTACRVIGSKEATNLLSRLRLGVSIGLIKDILLETVTSLFFLIQRSHIQKAMGLIDGSKDTQMIDYYRAKIIRERLDTDVKAGR
jgi:protein arginine kinase